MDFQKGTSLIDVSRVSVELTKFSNKAHPKAQFEEQEGVAADAVLEDVDVNLSEIYFLILHFLSTGPCQRTFGLFRNELLEHQLLPRRYHPWHSRSGMRGGDESDDGISFPLDYDSVVKRYSHIQHDHLVKLLKQLLLNAAPSFLDVTNRNTLSAVDVPTFLGMGPFSLLSCDKKSANNKAKHFPSYLRWPHTKTDQVHGLSLREIGGGFSKHHRAPSTRFACYAIAKPSIMVQRMQNIKKIRGHRDAVYCAIFDRSGRYVITGSDDRLVKIWSMETAFCLASCRGHEGDITDLAVSSNNALVASASNDYSIRVWRLPDGMPISVLRGHTGAVTAIAFSPRPSSVYQLLSSSDDGTCRIWDARYSHCIPCVYLPRQTYCIPGKKNVAPNNIPSSSNGLHCHQILCCAYNANGTVFVTGSSDTFARVWSACKNNTNDSEQPNHEIDVLAGHENDVNYVQFSGCVVAYRSSTSDPNMEENIPKFKNSRFSHDNIVTCSRDGSAIIWTPRSHRHHVKVGRWTQAYHLKVPPPPMLPQPPRGGPRQRLLPTPRGVNMIVWSLDNRFVLAAIMDCRICVWNASDGSLVHSLTGHSKSTYVLDVHPFNPRIAMSAGYDGKTIIWDIWEGIPIQIYETGCFQLVDGKFSQDGTSIVLSDDVGQIYLLSTGQGEYQKDAKYDQFFLGDYRPLIQDNHGNFLDQETQLAPYKRNIQDPLCDAAMIPYPEPYQSMYQRRRLGALGIEWRPPSIKFAVGPDIGLGQDYPVLPLPDLDSMFDPLPETIDAMYWEPEHDVINDDTDSEYNVAEEYSSQDERESLSDGSSSDPEFGKAADKNERSCRDGNHRSKRKKPMKEVVLITSSGRHVKRRNLNESDDTPSRSRNTKKSINGRNFLRRNSSIGKSLRPQRSAAHNAINSFEASSYEHDEDSLEDDPSEIESSLQGSDIQSKSNDNLQCVQEKYSKGKHASMNDSEEVVKLAETNVENRKGLVIKFSIRDSKKLVSENIKTQYKKGADVPSYSSSMTKQETLRKELINSYFRDSQLSSANIIDLNQDKLELGLDRIKNNDNTTNKECALLEDTNNSSCDLALGTCEKRGTAAEFGTQNASKGYKDLSPSYICRKHDSFVTLNHSPEMKDNPPPKSTLLKIKLKKSSGESRSPTKQRSAGILNVPIGFGGDLISQSTPGMKKNVASAIPDEDEGFGRLGSIKRLHYDFNTTDDAVQGRSMLHCARSNSDVQNGEVMESAIKTSRFDNEAGIDFPEATTDDILRVRSLTLVAASRETNLVNKIDRRDGHKEVVTLKRAEKSSKKVIHQFPSEEWTSTLNMASQTRSTRNKREAYYNSGQSASAGRKSHNAQRKTNWLLLLAQEEGYRYIPQLGDEVVYLRQGHQEYIKSSRSSELGPWISFGENIISVETCLVEELDYATLPGSGESCCKITLKFIDSSSSVFGKTFKLTLPELVDFPDFVIESARYDAAMDRNWTSRDKCLVWWRDESEEGGNWWEGRILSLKDKSTEFPGSPWERCVVRYKDDLTDHLHSPWELHDPDSQWKHPHINSRIRKKMKSSFTELRQSASRKKDKYGFLKLEQIAQKLDFENRFPVPLSPEIIELRLENNYYRSLEALEHDMNVMLRNAKIYFAKNAGLLTKMSRLLDWFERTLSNL